LSLSTRGDKCGFEKKRAFEQLILDSETEGNFRDRRKKHFDKSSDDMPAPNFFKTKPPLTYFWVSA